MGYVTESFGDRQLARMRGFHEDLEKYYRSVWGPMWEEALDFALFYAQKQKDHDMAIIYDVLGPEHGEVTSCRMCGAVVATLDQEKHDEWHEQQKPAPPEPENFGVFEEGTGVAVTCPRCASINCRFRDEFVKAGKREATLPFYCTKCENRFNITFSGSERWTGMVTESVS